MLKGIDPVLSPELLKVLAEMGHGDEIVISDANFPAASMAAEHTLVRADGIPAARLLEAILQLMPLDQYDANNFVLMEVVPGDPYVPPVWDTYREVLAKYEPEATVSFMERFAYYERAKKAHAVVITGETAKYANIILKKGVI
ncbi:MAG: L-fucose mutarotase [Clostridia bacterium]|nr:L-fucose mutarotase [Clostridia bacterium]